MQLAIETAEIVCHGKNKNLKDIITRASDPLEKVFVNPDSNYNILFKFQSLEIFRRREYEDIRRHIEDSLRFTDKFCARLRDRDDILLAVNTLLNPGDNNLDNYQIKIRRIFIHLLQRKITTVHCPEHPNIGTSLPELEQLLRAKTFLVKFVSGSPGEATSSRSPEQQPFTSSSCGSEHQDNNRFFKLNRRKVIAITMSITFMIVTILCIIWRVRPTVENEGKNGSNLESALTPLPPLSHNVTDRNLSDESIPITSFNFPNETVVNNSIRYTSTSPPKLTTPVTIANVTVPTEKKSFVTKKSKEKLVGQYVYLNSTKSMKEKTLEICDPNFATTLIFQIYDPVEWYGIKIDCATRIYGVIFQSYTTIKNLHEILSQTINIRNLTIECDKIGIRNNPLSESIPKIELNKLKYLETIAKNVISDCNPVFYYLSHYVSYFGKLQSWNISGIIISDNNAPEIKRVMFKMKASAPIKLFLHNVILQTFLDIRTKSMTYLEFHLSIHNISAANTDFAVETLTNFLSMTNYLKKFSSNVPIPDEKMIQVLEYLIRVKIETLELSVRVRDDRKTFEFKFTQKLRWLTAFELELLDWRKGDLSSSSSLLLTNFQLPDSLKEFRVITNFKALPQGAAEIHCRSFNKTRNYQGGINLMLDRCLDCNDGKGGCVSRRR